MACAYVGFVNNSHTKCFVAVLIYFLNNGSHHGQSVCKFWALSQTCEKRLLASSCLFFRPSAWNNLIFEYFSNHIKKI
jgi:hypothetical protein